MLRYKVPRNHQISQVLLIQSGASNVLALPEEKLCLAAQLKNHSEHIWFLGTTELHLRVFLEL